MPREQINYPDLSQKSRALMQRENAAVGFSDTDPAPSEFEPWNESSLHVQWVPEGEGPYLGHGWVQVGFEADLNYLEFAKDSPNGRTDDRTVMWSPVLSAGELDRMIAALKKAKRKAFPQG